MIRNIIFDFGVVLVDWDPHHLYDSYFNDPEKCDYFLTEVCPYSWNTTVDAGKSTADATAERIALFPEWEKEIRMYYGEWIRMMGAETPGMADIIRELKAAGYGVYGLTNWSRETFPLVLERYRIFDLLDGYVVSGVERVKKPDARLYRILLDRFSLKAEECIFIDDSQANLDGGEALGIRGILFESAEKLRTDLSEVLQGRFRSCGPADPR